MMSKKTKRLYSRMKYGIDKKQSSSRKLEEKRRILEEGNDVESKKQNPLKKQKINH